MEFNNIVNMYLKRDPEARDRNLYIKTYVSIYLFLMFNIYVYKLCLIIHIYYFYSF